MKSKTNVTAINEKSLENAEFLANLVQEIKELLINSIQSNKKIKKDLKSVAHLVVLNTLIGDSLVVFSKTEDHFKLLLKEFVKSIKSYNLYIKEHKATNKNKPTFKVRIKTKPKPKKIKV